VGLKSNEADYVAWLKNTEKLDAEQLLNYENAEDQGVEKEEVRGVIRILSNESLLKEEQFSELQDFLNKFPSNNLKLNNLVSAWEKITSKEINKKYLSALSAEKGSKTTSTAPNITSLEEKYERLADAYESMRNLLEKGGGAEEAERLKKKKAREEAKKKLDEAEFARRQSNLSEKDKKLAEEAEKRQKEKELAEQEAEAARKRQEERDKNISEDRKTLLDNEAKRLEAEKKRAEEELKFKEEQMRAEKEKKEQEIEALRKKNEQEEKELAQKKELMEQELAKELEAINIADREGRQRIEEKFRKRQNEIKKEMDALKRKNDDELKEKEAAAIKERQENELKLQKLREEVRIQNEQAQRAKEAADQQERLLRDERDKRVALDKLRKELYDAVMDYVFTENEGNKGTRNPTKGYGHLRTFLDDSPSMEFNLDFGDLVEVNKTNSTYRKAIQIFRKVVGNGFVTKGELRNLIESKVQSLDFLR
ncbi:13143_t:CDS:2, partial [Ambispora gerdemannii]